MKDQAAMLTSLHTIILWLEENVADFPSLPDMADADMAIMYLRHIEKHFGG